MNDPSFDHLSPGVQQLRTAPAERRFRRLNEGWYFVLGALLASGIYIGGGALLLILIIVLIVLLVR